MTRSAKDADARPETKRETAASLRGAPDAATGLRGFVKRRIVTAAAGFGFLLVVNSALPAGENEKASTGGAHESAVYKSTLQLNVRVYSFAGLPRWLLQTAEIEAARLLHDAHLDLRWVDCTSRVEPAACFLDPGPTDLVVRVLAKALPQAGANALGIAGSKRGEAIAFVFYDRIVALRTEAKPLPSIMGRVLAHEIVHVLLPEEGHSDFGLMRGLWSTDDLRRDSYPCMRLPATSVQLIQQEVVRRVVSTRSLALK